MARKDGKKTVPAKTKEEQPARLPRKVYEKELLRLQAELVKLQEWVVGCQKSAWPVRCSDGPGSAVGHDVRHAP